MTARKTATPSTGSSEKASERASGTDSGAGSKSAKPKRRADWEAIERDYRTGTFTVRELEAKHGANNATIVRRAARGGWTKDLAVAVRQATNAALIQEALQQSGSAAQQSAATTVLAAAELNKQVILGHRQRLTDLAARANGALQKLIALGDGAADVREGAAFMGALESYGRIVKLVIDKEREAHGIKVDDAPEDQRRRVIPLEFVEPEHGGDG